MSLVARGVAMHDPATEAFFTDVPLVDPMAIEWREREAWRRSGTVIPRRRLT
jgi:hypothetical protein